MEIRTSPHSTVIGCLHKSSNGCPSAFVTALESSLFRVDPEHNIVIVGDLNATCPSWRSTDLYNEAGRILEPALSTLNLYQHVSSPKHLRHDGSLGSLLDVIITNNNNVSAIKPHPPLGVSDHLIVECKLSLHRQPLEQKHVDLDWHPFTYFTCGETIAEVGNLERIFTSRPYLSLLRKNSWSRAKNKPRRFSLPSLHILHVRCQFCVIHAVRRNLQFLPV